DPARAARLDERPRRAAPGGGPAGRRRKGDPAAGLPGGEARARDRVPQLPRRAIRVSGARRDRLQRAVRRGVLRGATPERSPPAGVAVIAEILEAVALWIQGVISAMGYGGIVALMGIESACIPLPSEVIMPFAGSLVPSGRFTLLGCGLAGAIGCVVGSIP